MRRAYVAILSMPRVCCCEPWTPFGEIAFLTIRHYANFLWSVGARAQSETVHLKKRFGWMELILSLSLILMQLNLWEQQQWLIFESIMGLLKPLKRRLTRKIIWKWLKHAPRASEYHRKQSKVSSYGGAQQKNTQFTYLLIIIKACVVLFKVNFHR